MPITIKNMTLRPVIVPLNSGASLRLSPGEISDLVQDVELQENAKVGKLLHQRAIAIEPAAEAAPGSAEARERVSEEAGSEDAGPRRRRPANPC